MIFIENKKCGNFLENKWERVRVVFDEDYSCCTFLELEYAASVATRCKFLVDFDRDETFIAIESGARPRRGALLFFYFVPCTSRVNTCAASNVYKGVKHADGRELSLIAFSKF